MVYQCKKEIIGKGTSNNSTKCCNIINTLPTIIIIIVSLIAIQTNININSCGTSYSIGK